MDSVNFSSVDPRYLQQFLKILSFLSSSQCSLTAFPNDNNNRPSCKPTENESTNTDDLPSSSQLADVSRKIVFGEENGRATKRASSTETLIFEKRRRSSDYQQEYFHFLGL